MHGTQLLSISCIVLPRTFFLIIHSRLYMCLILTKKHFSQEVYFGQEEIAENLNITTLKLTKRRNSVLITLRQSEVTTISLGQVLIHSGLIRSKIWAFYHPKQNMKAICIQITDNKACVLFHRKHSSIKTRFKVRSFVKCPNSSLKGASKECPKTQCLKDLRKNRIKKKNFNIPLV